jgi:hypothetical protein
MKTIAALVFSCASAILLSGPSEAAPSSASFIDISVTPYYSSVGPTVSVGRFNAGLASKRENEFVATISKMKKAWKQLSFPELYVGAIRLYNLGYRREAVYWFYSAQYRGRQFTMLLDQRKMGSIGDPGFELLHAQDAFLQLVGPDINGYAFGDVDSLIKVVRRVQREGQVITDVTAIYPTVKFKNESEWKAINIQLNAGLDKLVTWLSDHKDSIRQQRVQDGAEGQFAKVTSKDLPGGL